MKAVEVVAGLVLREGKLLITQRPLDAHLGGLWEFPGGKRGAGESPEDCLRRELQEELGIEVQVGDLVASILHRYPEKTVDLKFFRCRWLRPEPRNLGCSAFRWVEAKELGAYAFPAADARLLARLQSEPALWGWPAHWPQ
jgi:mutator protein MutT